LCHSILGLRVIKKKKVGYSRLTVGLGVWELVRFPITRKPHGFMGDDLQGYLAHKKQRPPRTLEREFFIDNLLVRIHFIIEMIWWTGLAPWEF